MIRKSLAGLAVLFAAASASAQEGQRPQAGEEKRAVKALTEAEIADLLAGRGMGLAKAAEFNGYPGPAHLLEQAAPLKLTDAQRSAIAAIRARMAAAAGALGREIVARERALDAAFAEARIDAALLQAETGEIAALRGRLRAVHLAAHLAARPLLSPEQIARYGELCGHAGASEPRRPQPNRHH